MLAWFLAWLLQCAVSGTAGIVVVHPKEGMSLSRGEAKFITGSVSDPKSPFTINGRTVTVHSNGGFLALVPVSTGNFTFELELALKEGTTTLRRAVYIAPPPVALANSPLEIDEDSLWPKEDLELRPGDRLLTRMRASPGQKARFRLGKGSWQPLWESNPSLGLYEGVLLIPPDASPAADHVEFSLGSGWGAKTAKSRASVALILGPAPVAVVKGGLPVWVNTSPGQGNYFPALPGTRFLTAGREGPETKLTLASGQSASIETKSLEFLPAGAHPPRAVTDSITMRTTDESTSVRISLSDRVPFIVEEAGDLRGVTVRLHYTVLDTEWMVYKTSDTLVDEIRLTQQSSDLAAVTITFKPGAPLWGYQTRYEAGSLVLELKRPPRLAPSPSSPLKGIRVFLDPGHNPSSPGAIGPLGTREMDVNFMIAKAVETLLASEGAVPLLSRSSSEDEVPLADRPRLAVEKKADLFISIHNNNLNESANPFKNPYGYSIFYYQPHSLSLAREVYRSYEKIVPLPGEELRFGDLLIARMTEMPSIITESAYMTFPEQEEMLLRPRFRQKLASAIVDGLRSRLDQVRSSQKESQPQTKPQEPRQLKNLPPAKPKKGNREILR